MRAILGILALTAALAVHSQAGAQERVAINGVEAVRVVIAPARSDLARAIRDGLKADVKAQRPGTRAHAEALRLYYFYGQRYFEPLWLAGTADAARFSAGAERIIEAFGEAEKAGLRAADYLTPEIDLVAVAASPLELAGVETAFSAAALRYAQHLHGGRIRPSDVSGYITIQPQRLDETTTLIALADAEDPAEFFAQLEPRHREYQALKGALGRFFDGTAEEPVVVPEGPVLRLGMQDERVPLLRERLGVPAPETGVNTYDAEVVAAVEGFQTSLDLLVDGIAGPATIAALNGGSTTSRADIIANMERWRWLPSDMGDFHVHVNVPEFRLNIMRDGDVAHTTRVVTGTTKHQTPIFSDQIRHIVVNPYWNVPSSIAANEIGPQLQANPGYIARNNMQLLYGGQVVDAAAVDWSTTSVNQFRIRQLPGAGNALGSVKFLFPNQHDVYLHDTPSKSLFSRSYRAFSHGCIRVQNPWEFAAALLEGEPRVKLASLESQRGPSERWNNLERKVPVHITYFTLRVDQDGMIRSYGDVYGHNKKLIALLGL